MYFEAVAAQSAGSFSQATKTKIRKPSKEKWQRSICKTVDKKLTFYYLRAFMMNKKTNIPQIKSPNTRVNTLYYKDYKIRNTEKEALLYS